MRKLSLILFVLLVLVGCGEESEEITETKTESVEEFVGNWHAKSISGKSIDDYFNALARRRVTYPHRYRTNWDQCCSVDADMWIDFKIETVMNITKFLDDIGAEESLDLTDAVDEVDDLDEETKSETSTYLITEASYQLIPNTLAGDKLYQVEIEAGNWRINEDSLTLTYLDEDGSSFSLIYTKANQSD